MNTELHEQLHFHMRQLRSRWLLWSLKRQAIAKGRSAEWINEDRRLMRGKGSTASEIAACEFAELRLFEDIDDSDEEIGEAALAGAPSDVTMALIKKHGYCRNCVLHWFRVFAESYRRLIQEETTGLPS